MNMDLQRAVVESREREHVLKVEKDAAYSAFLEANAELTRTYYDAGVVTNQAEEALREAALGKYEVTKDKKPLPGVGIRVAEKLVYPEGQALLWANDHKMALVLDKREFERLMKAQAVKPGWVTVQEEVSATIATDLGAFLPTESLDTNGGD